MNNEEYKTEREAKGSNNKLNIISIKYEILFKTFSQQHKNLFLSRSQPFCVLCQKIFICSMYPLFFSIQSEEKRKEEVGRKFAI